MMIRTGGQTGVDWIATNLARSLGLKTGGWVPMGWTKTGIYPNRAGFGFQEIHAPGMSMPKQLVVRSKLNVKDSDGTLAFLFDAESPGTAKTVHYATTGTWSKILPPRLNTGEQTWAFRPTFVIRRMENEEELLERLHAFVQRYNIKDLNIAGHRRLPHNAPADSFERMESFLSRFFQSYSHPCNWVHK